MQSSTFPAIWFTIELIAYNYPNKPCSADKKKYRRFFESLGDVLPCKYCRDNYKENLIISNFSDQIFCCRDTLTRWVYDLHNQVNHNLGKPSYKTYEEVRDYYE